MLIADENIDYRIINRISKIPIDIISISKSYSGISDFEVIELSKNPPKIIITEDKDFGEWVFAHHIKDVSIIFLRYKYSDFEIISDILLNLLTTRIKDLQGKFTTITTQKIRIRDL